MSCMRSPIISTAIALHWKQAIQLIFSSKRHLKYNYRLYLCVWYTYMYNYITHGDASFSETSLPEQLSIGCKLRQRYLADVDIRVKVLGFYLIGSWKWRFWKRHGTITHIYLHLWLRIMRITTHSVYVVIMPMIRFRHEPSIEYKCSHMEF